MVSLITLDDLKNKKRAVTFFAGIGAIQFIIITIIAMFTYPRPYNFFTDPFSALGFMDANFNGIFIDSFIKLPFGIPLPNPISSVLFIIAIVIAAVATVPFWILMPSLFEQKKVTKIISKIGSIIGLVSAPLLVGVAFPADIFFEIHASSTMWFFLLFAIAIVIYTIAIFLSEDYQNYYAIFGVIVFAVAMLYVFVHIPILSATHQKITVYLFIAWPLFQAKKLWQSF